MPSILKKDKTNEEFEINKVIASMEKPFKAVGIDDPEFILRSAMFIQDKVYAQGGATSVDILDLVIEALMEYGDVDALKKFILFRKK